MGHYYKSISSYILIKFKLKNSKSEQYFKIEEKFTYSATAVVNFLNMNTNTNTHICIK